MSNDKDLSKIAVIGTGLLGASLTLAVKRAFPGVVTAGYSHRASTREKARDLGIADEIYDDIAGAVAGSDIVIIASPIGTFADIFAEVRGSAGPGCIVTDVGSTKVLPHKWAKQYLKGVCYVGSHPIAGSEKRGLEFARDDLFFRARCIVTVDRDTDGKAAKRLGRFWSGLGCIVSEMSPAEHDKVFARVSHVPHAVAAALVNATGDDEIKYAGKGFVDTSRVASGPASVWMDILLYNRKNIAQRMGKVIDELEKIKAAVEAGDAGKIEKLLEKARSKRAELIEYKINNKELL